MDWKKRMIGAAIGFVSLGACIAPPANADLATLGRVERFYGEIDGRTGAPSCDERARSFESRQMRPSQRRDEHERCLRLAREAAEARAAAARTANSEQIANLPATR